MTSDLLTSLQKDDLVARLRKQALAALDLSVDATPGHDPLTTDELSQLRLTYEWLAADEIEALRARLDEAATVVRPFASIPPVVCSEFDGALLYAAHYCTVVGRPDKSHFTREDLARAREFLQAHEAAK